MEKCIVTDGRNTGLDNDFFNVAVGPTFLGIDYYDENHNEQRHLSNIENGIDIPNVNTLNTIINI